MSCADCVQAYLQCTLDESTWVILPFELWLPEWKQLYDPNTPLAVRLVKSLYGHPQNGNLWQKFLEGLGFRVLGFRVYRNYTGFWGKKTFPRKVRFFGFPA